ncbi:DUF3906 family protein [Paenibacillus chitinolyticus]|uniref:DUF3906 family protein n=1 Tax=Paenibacillus chitinolyticus TaxID=79263 RepID=UPI002DC02A38|nr:DUF3906 family protein [Paenibacillus chitinolyticus]MEC0249086.1 DUF3906 family protein [Paenibacillus chitinolyticus]
MKVFLYKIELELKESLAYLIVVAETDAKAFDAVEGHLVRHFTVAPEVVQTTIIEKKRVGNGAGYVIESAVESPV